MPCQNDGICHDMIYSFRCSCPKGTAGMLCEINEPDCFDSACHHGGTCVDKVHFLENFAHTNDEKELFHQCTALLLDLNM